MAESPKPPRPSSIEDFEQRTIHFINSVLPSIHGKMRLKEVVDRDTSLFESGIIDSLAIVSLIAFVEETLSMKIPRRMVVMKHFNSIALTGESFWPLRGGQDGTG